ncbi:Prolyl-tRNA synthetase, archaeal/eukaryal type [Clostridiaceae bacterium JG1575]|nr:Prolyl-tRNA synthetase, archaeal/eukaryal type [Clostridiaceae bacterium JG1575]
MAEKQKKFVEQITDMNVDFAQWYTDVVKKAELADYSSVKGFMILRPYGFALWEGIQGYLDRRFKETGHTNVYMPMLIPENLLQKEKDHVEGFAPEVAWVTQGGSEELTERLCVRPTSETLFCEHYAKVVQSYNDLPKLYNQWCSVVRWEKTTRPFLRTSEFLWNEGHTVHATEDEAREETIQMLNIYAEAYENVMAIPVIRGIKTDKEKFAGARETYTVEAMMHDGKALQAGTSHYFGTGFAEAFNMTFQDRDGKQKHVHQTSWGLSTRSIGALIMVHGDNRGLVLSPNIAPHQVVIVPIAMHKEGVREKALELQERLKGMGLRVIIDLSDKSAGWKFAEYEMKGIPVRLEMGPKDIEQQQVVLVRRDSAEKEFVALEALEERLTFLMKDIHESLFEKAKKNLQEHTYVAHTMEELKTLEEEKPGFIKAMWCGDRACEERIKEEAGLTSRCIPFEGEAVGETCACCGKKAEHLVVWGKAY